MPRPPTTRADITHLAERVQSLVSQGLDVVEAYAAARSTTPSRELVRLEKKQAQLEATHRKAVARHATKVTHQRRNVVTLAATSVAATVLGVIDVASTNQALPGDPWMWLGGAAAAAVLAVRTRWTADHAVEPSRPDPAQATIALDARALRKDATGWAEAQGLVAVRRQVVTMLPAVHQLHPEAGRELAAAENEAGPVLATLVTRLVLLDQVVRDLPDTTAGAAAGRSADQVRRRLADGIAHYDRLLAAAAALLAAPDLGRPSAAVLGPAADALTAYTAGLTTAADS
ncbi:MAG TPA: hypothetical protein VFN19_09435 [Candidatus Nanopelagicales bacterium]|nr:hypothetical protein [Candidatus Nanopelagicales bacterium]